MKKNFIKSLGLALVLSLGVNFVCYAAPAPAPTTSAGTTTQQHKFKSHHAFYESDAVLKHLGLTEQDIVKGREAGKTLFDLTKDKKLSEKQVKDIIIEEINISLNNKVSVGKMTKEEAAQKLEKITAKIQNWEGKLEIKTKTS